MFLFLFRIFSHVVVVSCMLLLMYLAISYLEKQVILNEVEDVFVAIDEFMYKNYPELRKEWIEQAKQYIVGMDATKHNFQDMYYSLVNRRNASLFRVHGKVFLFLIAALFMVLVMAGWVFQYDVSRILLRSWMMGSLFVIVSVMIHYVYHQNSLKFYFQGG